MIHPKQHIVDIAEILYSLGISKVIIASGSRNVPLIDSFVRKCKSECVSLVDERSAAYYGLGVAIRTRKPAVLLCTSGTAVLNFAPAVVEAFYQGVPLIVLTADRPSELIDQQDNQTIHQENIFGVHTKHNENLEIEYRNIKKLNEFHKLIHKIYSIATSGCMGPVHINIPLQEPLYDNLPKASSSISYSNKKGIQTNIGNLNSLKIKWENSNRIFLVCGQHHPDEKLLDTIKEIAKNQNLIIIAESISNLSNYADIYNPDLLFNSNLEFREQATPDLVVYFGGQIVSKHLKIFLRKLKTRDLYFIDEEGRNIDTFQKSNLIVKGNISDTLKHLAVHKTKSDFKTYWHNKQIEISKKSKFLISDCEFSDLWIASQLSILLDKEAVLFFGNSSIIRMLQLFKFQQQNIYSNRGTSGIDGCISTASGIASVTSAKTYAIVGDLSFIYDSNGLWNRDLSQNLKIILINNNGGGIFKLLSGYEKKTHIHPFLEAHHPVDVQKLVAAYQIPYFTSNTKNDFFQNLEKIKSLQTNCIFEIKTNDKKNVDEYKTFLNTINYSC